jgi:cytochrome c oxidase subunit II
VTDTRREFDDLFFSLYLPVVLAVAAVVLAVVAFAILRSLGRPQPSRRDEHRVGESVYLLVVAVIAVVLVAATFSTEHDVDATGDTGPEIRVTASQWSWRFDYGDGGRSVVGNEHRIPVLVVPAHTTVRFALVSRDVIHAFFVPELRFKRDAFPGRTTRFDLRFGEPGSASGSCAEFCGLDHARMLFGVRVVGAREFRSWLRGS